MSMERRYFMKMALASAVGCTIGSNLINATEVPDTQDALPAHASHQDNPFFMEWTGPLDTPPFSRIRSEHFMPAYTRALAEHEKELDAIANATAVPTFENTIVALELSGRALTRVDNVFNILTGAHTNDALRAIQRETAPLLAQHWNRFYLNEALFRRIDALHRQADASGLSDEQKRVLDLYHIAFLRAGAGLDPTQKKRFAAINERLATLSTKFSQNVLTDEQAFVLVLESAEHLAGLPDFVCAAAGAAAAERGMAGKHVITLSSSSSKPFLQFSSRRDLREKLFRAVIARGDGRDNTDNKGIIAETLKIRAEQARILGYPDFAHYQLADSMAKAPAAVRSLIEQVWTPARQRALMDRDALQELIRAEGGDFSLAPWDWAYYAEKLRKQRHDIDEAAIKPYFQLDKMIEAAFYTANRLIGLQFEERTDLPVWHPDVRVWEVRHSDGRHVGLFFGDYFARATKRSGAWMSSLRDQERTAGRISPVIYNVMNFSKGGAGEPTLLGLNDARTLFHEFGHALHGLLSDVTYPKISGTSVFRDFVEFPSQLYENWLMQSETLRRFAVHYRTSEPMPHPLIERILAARAFNKGAETVGYLASALTDLDLHSGTSADNLDITQFEQSVLTRIEMPGEIAMFHRPTHFQHVFAGGYASGYYGYLWAEVLDADAFAAFEETGDVFDAAMARKLHDHIFAAGGSRDPADGYKQFRGRLPEPDALLRRRGFLQAG